MQSKSVKVEEEFPDVFKEEMGMLKGIEAEVELQQGVSPSHVLFHLAYIAR